MRKQFGDLTLTSDLQPGSGKIGTKVHCDYGPRFGSQTFRDHDEAMRELDGWADERINIISKELAAIAKLKRYIAKNM